MSLPTLRRAEAGCGPADLPGYIVLRYKWHPKGMRPRRREGRERKHNACIRRDRTQNSVLQPALRYRLARSKKTGCSQEW